MRQDYQTLFNNLNSPELPEGIFDKIIRAIYREQELHQTKKIFFSFVAMLVVSLAALPFSLLMLINQIKTSGTYYFISAALSDFSTFVNLWRNFSLAILESLPIIGLVVFIISLGLAVFTLKLFLYKKRMLFGYLKRNFNFA